MVNRKQLLHILTHYKDYNFKKFTFLSSTFLMKVFRRYIKIILTPIKCFWCLFWIEHHTFKALDKRSFTLIPLLKCRRNVILLLTKNMKQNTLFINCFSRKCSNPAFSKFSFLTFLMLTSPSQYLWPILYPKSSFQQMPWFPLTFLFFLIKIIPFIVVLTLWLMTVAMTLFVLVSLHEQQSMSIMTLQCKFCSALLQEFIKLSYPQWIGSFFCQTSLQQIYIMNSIAF